VAEGIHEEQGREDMAQAKISIRMDSGRGHFSEKTLATMICRH